MNIPLNFALPCLCYQVLTSRLCLLLQVLLLSHSLLTYPQLASEGAAGNLLSKLEGMCRGLCVSLCIP